MAENAKISGDKMTPVFNFSIVWAIEGSFILFAIFSVLTVRYLLSAPTNSDETAFGVTFLVGGLLISLVWLYQSFIQRVWRANFYERYAIFSGRGFKERVDYSAIAQTSVVRSWSRWPFTTNLRLQVKGRDRPIFISVTPTRGDSPNILSWLSTRISGQN
jgi:hypothetical protein